jgi:hypothetical protein
LACWHRHHGSESKKSLSFFNFAMTSRCRSSTLLEEVDSAGVDDDDKGQLVSVAGSPLRKLHMRASRSFRDLVLLPSFGFPCLCVPQLLMRKDKFAMAVKITSSPPSDMAPSIHTNSIIVVASFVLY